MIHVVTGDPRPIFKQIIDGLRVKIVSGELAPGTKLPSVRGLAMQLTINTNTVAKAYTELTNQGLVEARKGLGLFVSPPRQMLSREEQDKRLADAVTRFVNEVIGLEHAPSEVADRVEQELNRLKNDNRSETDSEKERANA